MVYVGCRACVFYMFYTMYDLHHPRALVDVGYRATPDNAQGLTIDVCFRSSLCSSLRHEDSQLPASNTMPSVATRTEMKMSKNTPMKAMKARKQMKPTEHTKTHANIEEARRRRMLIKAKKANVEEKNTTQWMPKKMVELKNFIEAINKGRAVTLADIKAAPGNLRNAAQNAMVYSLSEQQRINYKTCQSDGARHIWVAEYMRDPAKVRCCGVEDSPCWVEMLWSRRAKIMLEILASQRELHSLDTQIAAAGMEVATGLLLTKSMKDQMAVLQQKKTRAQPRQGGSSVKRRRTKSSGAGI